MKRFILPGLVLLASFAATAAFAATSDKFTFQPIIQGQTLPLPTNNLCDYLNALFKLSISISVVLAVIMIIIDGFKYMTSEAVGNKKDALGGIRSALGGLVLLLASYLLLFIINPQILSLSVVSTNGGALGGLCGTNVSQQGETNPVLVDENKIAHTVPTIETSNIDINGLLSTMPQVGGLDSSADATWCYSEGQGTFCFPGADSQGVCGKAAPQGTACTQKTSP